MSPHVVIEPSALRVAKADFHVVPDPKKIIQLGVLGKQGRYVRIQLLDKDYLSLAEVQVMGVDL
jgi:hypothetical protein